MKRGLGLAIALLIATSLPVAAQRTLHIERFDAAVTVNRDGTIDVVETITPKFAGQWNGIYRTIPVEYRTPQGFNWTLRLDLRSATLESGESLKTEVSRQRHYLKYKIWIPGAENTAKTIVLRYHVENAIRFLDDHDELYWNATGDEWDVPILAASATITLPSQAHALRAISFNGAYGSTAQDAEVAIEGTQVRATMPHALNFHEGLTVVVGWDKGLIPPPTQWDRVQAFLASNWPLVLPIPVFAAMFMLWRRRGRDPDRLPISVQYQPPDGLTPAEAGTLIDNSADMRDITSTIVDLAVRGFLKIEEHQSTKLLGLIKDREFIFHRVKPVTDWSTLTPHEQAVLAGMFEGGADTIELSDLENEFYKELPGIKNGIFDRLVSKGYYATRPDRVQGIWIGVGVVFGALVAIGGAGFAASRGMQPAAFIIAGIAIALIVIGFGYFMPARTMAGARMLERILGFEEFLGRVEGDRLRDFVKTPAMFEQCLPFAMAFGVEKKWAQAFQDIYREPPNWYVGGSPGSFNSVYFTSRLGEMSTRAATTMASSPRSSSGSGFSGGSSGGGFGGGGGGGF